MLLNRRERLESKLEKRREWADGRRGKAAALRARNEPYTSDYAFNTQPGHIPERARVIAREEKSFEHLKTAQHHDEKAHGLEAQLDRSIFADDTDAIEALEARIAEREAERDRYKRYNATCKAAAKRGEKHGDLSILSEAQQEELATLLRVCPYQVGPGGSFPSYALSNLGANIRRDRERIEEIRERQALQARVNSSTGGVVIDGGEWVRVTFAEKPERAVLEALREAGFRWGGGSWSGSRAKLPGCIIRMVAGV